MSWIQASARAGAGVPRRGASGWRRRLWIAGLALFTPGCPQLLDDNFDSLVSEGNAADEPDVLKTGSNTTDAGGAISTPDGGVGGADSDPPDASVPADDAGGGSSGDTAAGGSGTGGSAAGGAGGELNPDAEMPVGGSGGDNTGGFGGAAGGGGGGSPIAGGGGNSAAGSSGVGNLVDCVTATYNLQTYRLCFTAVTHAEARIACAADGLRLARPTSAQENTWLFGAFFDLGVEEFWLNGSDATFEGTWQGETGDTFPNSSIPGFQIGFQAWAPMEPSAALEEDCLSIQANGWHDRLCQEPLPYACQPN